MNSHYFECILITLNYLKKKKKRERERERERHYALEMLSRHSELLQGNMKEFTLIKWYGTS